MLKMPNTRSKYFSVKYGTKIQGMLYIPSVCYPLPSGLQTVIEDMAVDGLARIYTEKVRFVTGVPYPVKKPETGTVALRPPSVSAPEIKAGDALKQAVKKPPAAPEKSGRKSGRSSYAAQVNREFD
jgi:hypothetical protein